MTQPDATLCAFVYDERPTLNLMTSVVRDARRWPNLSIWYMSKDALISRSRSSMATKFLEQGSGDVLLMVDHDIGWEPGDLEHITQVCLDLKGVVGGVFPKRGFGLGVPVRFGKYGEYVVPSDRVVECLSVATGFFAVHREVLEAMAPTLPMTMHGYRPFFQQHSFERDDGQWEDLSEDYDFCQKARALGFKVFADLRPRLTHFGTHLFTVQDSTRHVPKGNGEAVRLNFLDPNEPVRSCDFKGELLRLFVDREDSFVSAALQKGQAWEAEVMTAIAEKVEDGDVIVEVGANLGAHTVQMAMLPGVEKVHAVEPMPHLVELLRKNVALHDLGEKVEVWPMAMVHDRDHRKTARMLRDYQNPGASHLVNDGDDMGVEVPTVRLADIGDGDHPLGGFDILKLDAEGAEYLILEGEGAREALWRCRVIVTEYCDAQLRAVSGKTGQEYLDLLDELGFDTGVEDASQLPVGAAYCNIVATRKEASWAPASSFSAWDPDAKYVYDPETGKPRKVEAE